MKQHNILLLLAGLLLAGSAHATDIGLSADIGTLGAGLHLATPLNSDLNVRAGFNSYNYSYTGSTTDVNYNFKFKLQTLDALLDYYPFSGSFRLSVGFVHNGNKITAVATPNVNGTYTINGNTYTSANAGLIDGNISFRSSSPYLGIGWGNSVGKDNSWGLTSDFGVISQGSPSAAIANSGCTAPQGVCTQLASDLAAENLTLDQKMHSYKTYPVVRLGLYYHF